MSNTSSRNTHHLGPHQHAHVAPTTEQLRTVGQRRREAEEKLERHLQEARHKNEHHDAEDGPEAGPSDASMPSPQAAE